MGRKVSLINKTLFLVLSFGLFILFSIILNGSDNDVDSQNYNNAKLVPPNPDTELPPSSSKLHIFKNAAVNSDSEVCSKIGK